MILDEMAERSPYLHRIFSKCHVVRVPFEVMPFGPIFLPDGTRGYNVNWTEAEVFAKLIPFRQDHTVSAEWARMPYPGIILTAQKPENGCILMLQDRPGIITCVGLVLSEDGHTIPGMYVELVQTDRTEIIIENMERAVLMFKSDGANGKPDGDSWAFRTPKEGKMLMELLVHADEYLRGGSLSPLRTMTSKYEDGRTPLDVLALDSENVACRAMAALALLGCRNIAQEEVRPDRKLQAARAKRGKLPLYRHHVLVVKGIRRRSTSGAASTSSEPLALHWVRGHFKEFTADKPLFGRITGRFWWSPHLAGQADRVVTKDYELR